MPPAVGLGIAGAGLLGSGIAGGIGASRAAGSARNAREQAMQQFQFAQGFRPELFGPSTGQQQALLQALQGAAFQAPIQVQPEFFTQEAESAAEQALRRRAAATTEQGRQRVAESSARRGLFRSGVGAQQEREFLQDRGTVLNEALDQQALQFQQARADEARRAAALNIQGRAGQLSALGSLAGAQSGMLGQQQDLFRALLGQANQSGQSAAQQRLAANQAMQQAIQGPFQSLGQLGALGAFGGFGGLGGGGASFGGGAPVGNFAGGNPFGLMSNGRFFQGLG